MPYSQCIAGREPPSILDRLLAHAQSITLSLLTFSFGVLILLTAIADLNISRSLANAHGLVIATIAVPLLAGPPAIIWGSLNPRLRLQPLTAMMLERAGSIATGAGVAAFALGIVFSGNTLALGTGLITTSVAAAFWLRAVALWVTDKRVRQRLDAEQRTEG